MKSQELLQRLGQWCRSSKTTLLCFAFLLFLSSCSPGRQNDILGVWQQKEDSFWDVIEFRADGTFLFHDAFGTHSVKYTRSERNRIRLEFERSGTNGATVAETLVYGVAVTTPRQLELANLNSWGNAELHHYHKLSRAEAARLDLCDFKGSELVALPETAALEQILDVLFKNVNAPNTNVTEFKIEKTLMVITSRGSPWFIVVNTNRGRKGVYLEFDRPQIGVESLRGWWCRIEELPASERNSF